METTRELVTKRIISAAKSVFIENGIEHAGMREIAKQSDMTVGNLYRYFESKDDIIDTIIDGPIESFNKKVLEKKLVADVNIYERSFDINLPLNDFMDTIKEFVEIIVNVYYEDKTSFKVVVLYSDVRENVIDWLSSLIESVIVYSVGTYIANPTFTRSLSHCYAVSIYAGLKDLFLNSSVDEKLLKEVIMHYFTSFFRKPDFNIIKTFGDK